MGHTLMSEQSITAITNDSELPAWYRTDTAHSEHPHNTDAECLPNTAWAEPCASS